MDEKKAAERFDDAAKCLGALSARFNLPVSLKARVQEIRLRAGQPVVFSLPDGPVFIKENGLTASVCREVTGHQSFLSAQKENIDEAFRLICDCSVHSHQREIKNGFITLGGGHRAGICGTAVTEDDAVVNIRDISSINLRVARDIAGAADETAKAVLNGDKALGSILFGPPGCGKTTVLRDLARRLSSGDRLLRPLCVAVIDERGELAATYKGRRQIDLGPCCDVLDGYPKGEGILQAVRCLAPEVIICDEIGGEDDARAIKMSLNAGVTVIASAHAGSLEELMARPQIADLVCSGAFKRAVRLYGKARPGTVAAVYGEESLKAADVVKKYNFAQSNNKLSALYSE